MDFLLPVLLVIAAITLIGHGIWVVLAWIFQGGRSKPRTRVPVQPTHCPRCGTRFVGGDCAVCRWPLGDYDRNPRPAALHELRRQLERYVDLGLIDRATALRLDQQLVAEMLWRPTEATPPVAAALPERTPVEPETELPLAEPAIEPAVERASAAQPTEAPQEPEQTTAAEASHGPAEDSHESAEEPAEQVELLETPAKPVVLSPEERVREYVARQQTWEAEPAPPVTPRPPRRPWTDLLSAFMEEKNIRWGELVGGLMIVGCSVALVISFWARIAERPLLKFIVFNGVTAALFGLGLYSERRWKLRTTSTGLLLTASLLVPLNFLSIAAFTQGANAGGVFTILGELISIALFAALLHAAGRIVLPGNLWALPAGALVPSVLMLLTRRFIEPQSPSLAAEGLGWLIVVAHAACNGLATRSWPRQDNADAETRIPHTFKLLGISSFASFLALAFLMFQLGDLAAAFQRLSPLVCAVGLTPLAVGLSVWRGGGQARFAPQAPQDEPVPDDVPVAYRTAGLSIAIAGALLLVAGVVLSWPQPLRLLATSGIAGTTLVVVAWLMPLPQAYLAALPCSVLAYLVVWHRLRGHFTWREDDPGHVLRVLASGESGQALLPLAVAIAGAAWACARRGRKADGRFLAFAAVGAAALSIAALGWFGGGVPGDPLHVGLFYTVYAAVGYVVADWLKSRIVLCGCAALLLAAVVQSVVFHLAVRWELALPWATAMLVDVGLMAIAAAVLARSNVPIRRDAFAPLVLFLAKLVSLAALILLGVAIVLDTTSATVLYPRLLVLWLVWLAIAGIAHSRVWFFASQVCLVATIWFAVIGQLEWRTWFRESHYPWLDPWTITAEGIALTVFCLAAFVVRGIARRFRTRGDAPSEQATAGAALRAGMLGRSRLTLESALLQLLLVAAAVVAFYAALPGVAQELSPEGATRGVTAAGRIVPAIEQFELIGIPHDHAHGTFVWLWLLLLAVALVAEMAVRKVSSNLLLLLFVAFLACPLLASGWQSEVATASALRWLTAGYLLLVSAAIWFRGPLAALAGRCGWQLDAQKSAPASSAASATAAVLVLSLAPPLAMAIHIGIQAVLRYPPGVRVQGWFWPLGVWFVVAAMIALTLRGMLSDAPTRRTPKTYSRTSTSLASSLLLFLGAAPLVAVVLSVVSTALTHSPLLGPDPSSWFARIGLATSYAAPVLAIALALVGYAVRERSARFAIAAGLVLNLGVTAACLLAIANTGLQLNAVLWIRLAQVNAIASAAFALAWMGVLQIRQLRTARETNDSPSALLVTQASLPVALNVLVLIPAWAAIFWNPGLTARLAPVGSLWGWVALLLTLAVIAALRAGSQPLATLSGLTTTAFALGTLIATRVGNITGYGWDTFHTLLVCHVATLAGLAVAVGWPGASEERLARARRRSRSAVCAVLPVALLAARSLFNDPQAPWWTVGSIAVAVVIFSGVACVALRRGPLHACATLIVVAALGWWSYEGTALVGHGSRFIFGFWQMLVISLALPAVAWALCECFVFAPARELATRVRPPAQRLAVRLAVVVFAVLVSLALFADVMNESDAISLTMQWVTLAAVVVGATALLWDAGAGDAVALLYMAGLLAAGTLLDALDLHSHWMLWLGTITLAAYVLATSYLWSCRAGLRAWGDLLRVPRAADVPFAHQRWLVSINSLLIAVVILLTFAIELTYTDAAQRAMAAKSVLAAAIALGLLARGERRTRLQLEALVVGTLWAIALAWSPLDPGTQLIHRLVATAAALGAAVVIYGIGFSKLLPAGSEWLAAALRIVPKLAVATGVVLAGVLVIEAGLFATYGGVQMAWQAIVLVAVTLIGLTAAALAAALLPGRDPLQLSERGRQVYVYAAEILLALCFVHIRLTMPWLFGGVFSQYWPVIVMAIAFVGAGVGEWFRRRQMLVLGDPLETTGALLPLLPVLAFWILPTSRVDYSLLLLGVGLLYAGLSVARKSFGFGVLAAVSANGGLWYFLNRLEGFRLLEHPQLWLIPPALCVLAAAQINRKQLTAAQMTAIRYGTSILVYVSSTADVFLNGVAQAPWLPLVLAAISLAGIFAGILWRIRAFLFMGIAFLLLAILTVIWHAAVNLEQTWLWWASGIVVGILIIAVFAIFEKKRDEVLHVLDQLKEWQS